jgi:hypothetical protein
MDEILSRIYLSTHFKIKLDLYNVLPDILKLFLSNVAIDFIGNLNFQKQSKVYKIMESLLL